jgi:hypothetical protein
VPEVSVVVELRVEVDEEGLDPVALEHAVAAEGRRAARELCREALTVLDRAATSASDGARQRLEPRWVATVFGRLRIRRYPVKAPPGPGPGALPGRAHPGPLGGPQRPRPAGPVPPGR